MESSMNVIEECVVVGRAWIVELPVGEPIEACDQLEAEWRRIDRVDDNESWGATYGTLESQRRTQLDGRM